jgi:hypothetical protein
MLVASMEKLMPVPSKAKVSSKNSGIKIANCIKINEPSGPIHAILNAKEFIFAESSPL